ncbi:FAD-dependent oxidoreductase [Acaryochloris sp. IP29b_bin.148]|uniref:FAD-dependent oxidoreductase n=1 Tax=Acaryochloris sp. IP29b_bin.148 TaxID=2969218 RepID=UPI002622FC92|nr:FAD-dependent oxidoreductase [Acaryochloris sp. IP29b_bin.148]
MAGDYDLVVVGNNAAARFAAIAAKQRSARVALISVAPEAIPHHLILSQWAQTRRQPPLGAEEWAAALILNLQASRSPAKLASLGIEQIDGVAQFCHKPQLQVQVQNRVLRSRRYLLCLDADLPPPDIPGMPVEDWIRPAQIMSQLETLDASHSLLVVGEGPVSTILSQALAHLGYSVHLLSQHSHLLPGEDAEAALRVQAHLEAEGVHLYTHCQIKEVLQQPLYQVVTADQGTLIASALIWAEESSSACLDPNRVTVNLRHTPQGLWVNAQLQTSHPQIYACGSVLGGYTLADIAHYEATVAVHNTLSRPKQVDYQTLPWAIQTVPALARVGLTEAQAQQTAQPFQVIYQPFKNTERGRLQDEQSGWCKLIVHQNGQILGAHVVGPAASEIVHLVSMAMKQQCSMADLTEWAAFEASYGSIVGQAAQQWNGR